MSDKKQVGANMPNEGMETESQEAGFDSDEEGGLRIDEHIYIPPPPKNVKEASADGPRLMITKIANVNFKSYAGRREVGPFHKCFSAIVGPNGSGKSNVIDSLLFVFGYRASKIRSKKLSVLIHNSSEHPGATSCTVAVHFQSIIDKGGMDYDIVPNSEFVISRTALKDNSSYYEYNGKKVQFKEVAKTLRSYGIDLDYNRFLILQGEVEQIAMMKPKGQNENDTGMLEFLEDIIGTCRYKEPLEKLYARVELHNEQRVEKINRLRVAENERTALIEPMQEAVEYLRMENSIMKLQHKLYHCKRSQLTKEIGELTEKGNELDKDLSNVADEMASIIEQQKAKNNDFKEKNKKWDHFQSQKDKSEAKFNDIRKRDELLHAEFIEVNKQRKAHMASVKTEDAKLQELLRVPDKSTKNIEECQDLLKKTEADKEKSEAVLATLMEGVREKTEPLLAERAKFESQLISCRKDVDKAKAEFDIGNSKLQLYLSEERTEKEKLQKLSESLESMSNTVKQRKEQLSSLAKKIPASEESLRKAQKELNEAKAQEENMSLKLRSMRLNFEEQRSAMQDSRSRNKILDALMQQKREGRIPGIFGRLGDLGAIDAKYDVAISTACGPLDNIVVDTVDTAQECITFLRNNNIGRATFIALEKQQRFLEKCKQKIDTPQNARRLFDLIKVEDEQVLPAFYYALQDTLVADNIDHATEIAYGAKRFRVVTLKGELIELSGTMSGGGKTVFRGRMGQKVVRNSISAADVDKLQINLDAVYEEYNRLKAKVPPLENQVHTLNMALKDMKSDRDKYNVEVQALKKQEPALQAQLKAQEKKAAECVVDAKEAAKMKKVVEQAEKHLEKEQQKCREIEENVNRINGQIEEVTGDRVKLQEKEISRFVKQIDKAKAEICRLEIAKKTAERNAEKATKRIETLQQEIQACEQRLRDIQKAQAELDEEGKVLLKEIEEASVGLKERDEVLAVLKEELDALQARLSEIKAHKIDLAQRIKENKGILNEHDRKVTEYTKRITTLKLRDIPGEEVPELTEFPEEEVENFDAETIARNLQNAKSKLPQEIPNMHIITEFKEKDTKFLQRKDELQEITNLRNKIKDLYDSVRQRRLQEFTSGFSFIAEKVKEMYQMITLGGDAELEFLDSLDPFSEGVALSVRPPKKSWKDISNLSGGEKTLSSLALVFALHHYKPSPLYLMDEIDAALDFKNVSIVGNYIKERTRNTQFIVISLRSDMFELADVLVGIYKTKNCTKCASLNVERFCETHHIKKPSETVKHKAVYGSQKSMPLTQDVCMRKKIVSENASVPTVATCPAALEKTNTLPEPSPPKSIESPESANMPLEPSPAISTDSAESVCQDPPRRSKRLSSKKSLLNLNATVSSKESSSEESERRPSKRQKKT